MSTRKETKESRRSISAQDQESDSSKMKKQQLEPKLKELRAPARSNIPEKAKGREISPSRGGNHPLPKLRNRIPKEPVRIQAKPNANMRLQVRPAVQKTAMLKNKAQPKSPNNVVKNKIKVPKAMKKDELPEHIQSRLKKKSPWYQSIRDPVSGGGTKIPDPIGTETGTYQHVENVVVTVNEKDVAGLRIVSPYINNVNVLTTTPNGLNYQITTTAAEPSNLTWCNAAGTEVPDGGSSFARVPDLMKANARSHRIVSAAIVAQSETSTLNNQGEACAFVTPFGINPNGSTYTDYTSQYDSTIIPVNAMKPVIARWYPLQAEANAYANGPSDEWAVISYQDFVNPNDDKFAGVTGVIPWEMGVVYTGVGTGVVRFQIIINYEFIPLFMTTMVSTSPSPVDQVEETLVNNWISESPPTEIISQHMASKAPSVSTVSEDSEPSGIGMLFNVIEEVLPYASKVIPLLL